jgi:hypothetical protein
MAGKRQRLAMRALTTAVSLILVYLVAPGCSLATGQGVVTGNLNVADCWSGKFNLNPDFFAAIPYRDTLDIRIQSGGDFQTFSDGISILVDNVHVIRGDAPFAPGLLHTAIPVSLSPGVTAPGVPVMAVANPALVHLAVYLQRTCHTQDVALYAVDKVSLNANGTCGADDRGDPGDGGLLTIQCPGAAASSAAADASSVDAASEAGTDAGGNDGGSTPLPTASSTITFDSLFNGNPDETDADQRHTVVPTFDVYLADPRDACPGGLGPPPPCRGHLTGRFDFYFQRGRPAQPFP